MDEDRKSFNDFSPTLIPFGETNNINNNINAINNVNGLNNNINNLNGVIVTEEPHNDVCEILDCSFNATQTCSSQLRNSGWLISSFPTADLLGGIPGDASQLPFNVGK